MRPFAYHIPFDTVPVATVPSPTIVNKPSISNSKVS